MDLWIIANYYFRKSKQSSLGQAQLIRQWFRKALLVWIMIWKLPLHQKFRTA